jgi:hypothetical protein
MSNRIKIGDTVSVLDDDIEGKVIATDGMLVLLLDQNGFEREYKSDELVKYDRALDEDRTPIKKQVISNKTHKNKKASKNLNVIDLHHNSVGLAEHTILESQLKKFKLHLNKAIRNRTNIITFIPGIGEGILRNNIERILNKNQIKYCDAPYHKFGNGAVEVHLKGVTKVVL